MSGSCTHVEHNSGLASHHIHNPCVFVCKFGGGFAPRIRLRHILLRNASIFNMCWLLATIYKLSVHAPLDIWTYMALILINESSDYFDVKLKVSVLHTKCRLQCRKDSVLFPLGQKWVITTHSVFTR